jgi:hypothetical protein
MTAMIAEPVDHRFASIDFFNKKDPGAIPLQAADFLSHVIATNKTEWINRFVKAGRLPRVVKMTPEDIKRDSHKVEIVIAKARALRRKDRRESLTSLDGEPDTT